MSLVDVDSQSLDRGSPQPNGNDEQVQRMAHGTHSISYAGDTPQPSTLIFKNNMILTTDANGKISSVYGYVAGAGTTPILIIANQGYDVFTDILGIASPLS